jgi:hypothetical protein
LPQFSNATEVELDVVVAPGTPAHGMSFFDRRPGVRKRQQAVGAPTRRPATLLLGVDGPRFERELGEAIARVADGA